MRIHDSDMSLHLLDFDQPVEASFEEYLMDTRDTLSLSEHECKRGLEISRESWVDVGLYIGWDESRSRVVDGDSISFSIGLISDSSIRTLPEEGSEISYASSLDTDRGLCRQGCEYNKSPTLYIVMYYCRFCLFLINYRTIYDHIMLSIDIDTDSERPEKVHETQYMWFDRGEFDRSATRSEGSHHKDILSCGDREVGSDRDILTMILSLKCYIITFTHILIAIRGKCLEMLIDRTFPDITSTRIWDLECTKTF
jgi:hypothetical protein